MQRVRNIWYFVQQTSERKCARHEPDPYHPSDRRHRMDRDRRAHPPVYNPATGAQTGVLDLASKARSTTRSRHRPRRPGSRSGRTLTLTKRTQVLFARELLNAKKEEISALITAEHGGALPTPSARSPRPRSRREFACGIPHLLRAASRECLDARRCLLDPAVSPSAWWPSSRSFNFPAMVPLWFVPIAIARAAMPSSSSRPRRIRRP